MNTLRRDSFTLLRETMRWRVAVVLSALIFVLTLVLGSLNTRLGLDDTALLAWIVAGIAGGSLAMLLLVPRHVGGTLFFVVIALLLIGVIAFGWMHGRNMQHWAYIFPPVVVFLLGSRRALATMVLFGIYTSWLTALLLPPIEVVRFASGYGLLVCFMFTYALLQERAAQMLSYHSEHDALTNCLNRRNFNETMEQLSGPRSPVRQCAVLLVDIDHFKAINDQHGHLVGDRVITAVAAGLGRHLDAGTPLFRYGGEEFAVVLPGRGLDDGLALAETLRAGIAGATSHGQAGTADVRVTVSIGVAAWQQGDGTLAAALDRADQALYDAKRAGRNRVAGGAA